MIGPAIGLLWFRIIEPIFLVLRYFHYRDVKKCLLQLEDHIKDVHCYNTGTYKMQKLNGKVSVYADGQIEIIAQQNAKLVELKLTFEKMTERLQQKIITHLEAERVPKSAQGYFER